MERTDESYSIALTPRESVGSVHSLEEKHSLLEEENPLESERWYHNPSVRILVGCVLGIVVGYLMGKYGASKEVVSWISLPGELFLRALTCVVVPLVFVNIFLSVVDMLASGHAAKSGIYTVVFFVLTTALAVLTSFASVLLFKVWFSTSSTATISASAETALPCGQDTVVQWFPNGTLLCASLSTTSGGLPVVLPHNDTSTKSSLSQTIQDQIFRALVPDNIVQQFISGNYLGIMSFAIFLAVSMQKVKPRPTTFIHFCQELNATLLVCIRLIIDLTPIAVFSLVSGGLGTTSNLKSVLSDVGIFLVSFLAAIFIHYFVTLMGLLWLVTRRSPWEALSTMWPAQVFAFCCASSAATLPETLHCADSVGVPKSIASFVITMGATLHMNGTSIYFPCAIIYLAVSTGDEAHFTAASFILLGVLSMMSAIAAAPVPSAALVLVIPMFNTVCGTPL
ncbi:hypothetical protein AC1031_005410 [Aphanomyces cochlioides]|nr:hypothetical protein AC1031_005410 [Aphanomyces cochlioides]